MFISFRVKFDKGFRYYMDIENMRFFCCQVYMLKFMIKIVLSVCRSEAYIDILFISASLLW